MQRKLTGVGLIALALLFLFKEHLELDSRLIWFVGWGTIFGVLTFEKLMGKRWFSSILFGILTFFTYRNLQSEELAYLMDLAFEVDLFRYTLVIIAMVFGFYRLFVSKADDENISKTNSDPILSPNVCHVRDDNFINYGGGVVFSSISVEFSQAVILGDVASYSGKAVFSSVTLYVPKNWEVEYAGEHVLSRIDIPSSGEETDKTLVVSGDFTFSRLRVRYI